jgi:protein-disulfide isomerase
MNPRTYRYILAALTVLLIAGVAFFVSLLRSPSDTRSEVGDSIRPATASQLPLGATLTTVPVPEKGNTDLWYGSPEADVRMFVYSDLECPFCRQLEAYFPDFLETFGDLFSYTYRHYPLTIHPQADMESEVSLCAQEQSEDVAKKLIRETFKQTSSSGSSFTDEQYRELAVTSGADSGKLQSCLANGSYKDVLAKAVAEARDLNVRYTPTVFIRAGEETVVIEGAQEKQVYDQAIRYLLGVVE